MPNLLLRNIKWDDEGQPDADLPDRLIVFDAPSDWDTLAYRERLLLDAESKWMFQCKDADIEEIAIEERHRLMFPLVPKMALLYDPPPVQPVTPAQAAYIEALSGLDYDAEYLTEALKEYRDWSLTALMEEAAKMAKTLTEVNPEGGMAWGLYHRIYLSGLARMAIPCMFTVDGKFQPHTFQPEGDAMRLGDLGIPHALQTLRHPESPADRRRKPDA